MSTFIAILTGLRHTPVIRRFRSGGILENFIFRSELDYIEQLYRKFSKNDPESPTLDPERYFIDLRKNIGLPDD